MFNRSITMHSTHNSDFPKKPYQYERTGSMKKFYDSSFDSVVSAGSSIKGKVRTLCSLFESPKSVELPSNETSHLSSPLPFISPTRFKSTKSVSFVEPEIKLPGTENRVVVYFTSLRGIRRTYEDCHSVRMILRGFRVMVDERDISMDCEYRKELQCVLGQKNVTLPQVFIRGKYIGGADIIKQLHEIGELAKILKGLPIKPIGYVCEYCGDARFVPCGNCSGSKKIFDEDEDMLKRCPECNENGLIRCPTCCS